MLAGRILTCLLTNGRTACYSGLAISADAFCSCSVMNRHNLTLLCPQRFTHAAASILTCQNILNILCSLASVSNSPMCSVQALVSGTPSA